MSAAGPLRGPGKGGGCAAAVLAAPAKGTGPPPPASRVLRIALRATALRAALDPGDPCSPWEQEKRAGHKPAPARKRAQEGQPILALITKPMSPHFQGNPY